MSGDFRGPCLTDNTLPFSLSCTPVMIQRVTELPLRVLEQESHGAEPLVGRKWTQNTSPKETFLVLSEAVIWGLFVFVA